MPAKTSIHREAIECSDHSHNRLKIGRHSKQYSTESFVQHQNKESAISSKNNKKTERIPRRHTLREVRPFQVYGQPTRSRVHRNVHKSSFPEEETRGDTSETRDRDPKVSSRARYQCATPLHHLALKNEFVAYANRAHKAMPREAAYANSDCFTKCTERLHARKMKPGRHVSIRNRGGATCRRMFTDKHRNMFDHVDLFSQYSQLHSKFQFSYLKIC